MNLVPLGIFTLVIMVLPIFSAFAEDPAPVTVEVDVDRTQITIGDQIEYRLDIEYDQGVEIQKPTWGEGLEGFQILDFERGQPEKVGDRWRTTDTYTLSTYTPEDYLIPPLQVPVRLPSGATQVLETQPILVNVASVLPTDEASLELRDIKDPVSVFSGYLPHRILIAIVSALAVLLFLYLVWKRRHAELTWSKAEPPKPEHEIASARLLALREEVSKWGENPDWAACRGFGLELSEIFREYLERRYAFTAREMTTEEIGLYVFANPLEITNPGELKEDASVSQTTMNILKETDLMKFAKTAKPREALYDLVNRCEEIIRATRRPDREESEDEGAWEVLHPSDGRKREAA